MRAALCVIGAILLVSLLINAGLALKAYDLYMGRQFWVEYVELFCK